MKAKEHRKCYTLKLPPSKIRALQALAKKTGRTTAGLVELGIELVLADIKAMSDLRWKLSSAGELHE